MIEVNSLWIGSLSSLETMCMKSHLVNGHVYNLWCYEDIGPPAGIIVKDGNDILPEKDIFPYKVGEGKGSFSAFSNFFRYKLLWERGGWWVDTDVCCLKEFDFTEDIVLATEQAEYGYTPTTCVIKCPANSSFIRFCWEKCQAVNKDTLTWGTIGPNLLKEAVYRYKLENYLKEPEIFCPIDWSYFNDFFKTKPIPDAYAIHLWNEMWRRNRIDKEQYYNNSIYGQLRERYFCPHTSLCRQKHCNVIRYL